MNDDEHDKLEQIHDDVRKSKTQINVIDERTEHMDSRMNQMEQRIDKNKNDIDGLQSNVNRNTTVLGGISAGAMAVILWGAEKVATISSIL